MSTLSQKSDSKKSCQTTNVVLMIRPTHFRCNEQTAVNNYFQNKSLNKGLDEITAAAQKEFDDFTTLLIENGIKVLIVQDNECHDTPDSVFPNNWISFHQDASTDNNSVSVNIYPMYAVNRRYEKQLLPSIASTIEANCGTRIMIKFDYSPYEDTEKFLEGTGSLILDRDNYIAYCACSPRAHPDLLTKFCDDMGYTPVQFAAYQSVGQDRMPIYHTNVMMCVAETFAIVCLDCIDIESDRARVVESLNHTDKEIVAISEDQMGHFAGNMLQLRTEGSGTVLVMSSTAYSVLSTAQRNQIEGHCPILHASLHIIEENGGGSARCMMAEVFLQE